MSSRVWQEVGVDGGEVELPGDTSQDVSNVITAPLCGVYGKRKVKIVK